MAATNQKVFESVPVDPTLLERANWWFDISWYGLLIAGVIAAIGACATIAFLFVQYWSSGIRDKQSEWRTSTLELQTADAKRDTTAALERIAGLNKDTVRLAADAEASRERAAALEKEAATLKLQLAERTQPLVERRLKPEQIAALADKLRGSGIMVSVMVAGPGREINAFAGDFIEALRAGGVLGGVVGGGVVSGGGVSVVPNGINISGPDGPEKARLESAFVAAAIPYGT